MSERIFNNVKITSSFEIPETRENLVSGETIGQHFGKIAKVINDLENGEFSSKITIDTELSDTSTNPVQNKIVKQAIDNKADKSLYGDTTINVGRLADSTVGDYSTAEGSGTTASEYSSHAEGDSTTASGESSHAEGFGTTASEFSSHAEGYSTTAGGRYSHAGGYYTKALKVAEFAHGQYNQSNNDTLFSIGDGTADNARHNAFEITTTGGKLHDKDIATTDLIPTSLPANGGNADTLDGMHASDITASFALKSLYGDTTINVGRKAGTTVGKYSTAEGYNTTASGSYSHSEGDSTTASDGNSHAEGYNTTASGWTSHAEGAFTTASGSYSHAEGFKTTASYNYSHAEGYNTTASNAASHAGGHYNTAMTTGGSSNNTTGTAFVIGNGTSDKALSNAFSVQFDGTVKAKSTITASTTADYAEFFEWLDENPDNEDRVGYFVTLDGDKIRIATAADDYILGVVSGEPFVLGNGDCDTWNGMYLHDEFRRTIYEPAPKMVEILDSEGNPTGECKEVEGEFEGTRPKLNPEYDHTKSYISRFNRKEWAPVGMLGVLAVRHDGTAKVNGYVTVNADGIATACEKSAENAYRVIKSNTDSVVEIIFR